jgi:hypothetical protein
LSRRLIRESVPPFHLLGLQAPITRRVRRPKSWIQWRCFRRCAIRVLVLHGRILSVKPVIQRGYQILEVKSGLRNWDFYQQLGQQSASQFHQKSTKSSAKSRGNTSGGLLQRVSPAIHLRFGDPVLEIPLEDPTPVSRFYIQCK